MMPHYPLYPRVKFSSSIQEKAIRLLPLYRRYRLEQPCKNHPEAEQQPQNSSPVCYAHLVGMREGFDDQL